MAEEKPSLTKLWKQAQAEHGYNGSFADFADVYNKNKHEAQKGLENFVGFLKNVRVAPDNVSDEEKLPFEKQKTKPKTRIFGMPPAVAIVVVVVGVAAFGYGVKVLFFNNKKAA